MHHVLHERIPCPSFKILSTWWKHESMIIKSRVIHHYVIRVVGTLKLLNHLDIIGEINNMNFLHSFFLHFLCVRYIYYYLLYNYEIYYFILNFHIT